MAPLSVAGKFAIITGAGSGINLAFARLLLNRGCSVLIGDLNLRPEAKQLLSQYSHRENKPTTTQTPKALFQPTDVTSWPQLSSLFTTGLNSFPQIDIVAPGAGLFEPPSSNFWHPPGTSLSRDSAEAEPGTYKTLDVNLTHPIRLSQLAIGYWSREKMPGCLVHVSSIAGHSASLGTPLYFASKHGLHGFVRALGGLREGLGVRVGAVAPGAVRTPLWSEDPEKAAMSNAGEDIPMMPEEIAEGMLELCENSKYGDGTILEVTLGARRVVPLYNADPPSGKGNSVQGYVEAAEQLLERLKRDGLRT